MQQLNQPGDPAAPPSYTLVIKNEKKPYYRRISLWLLGITLLILLKGGLAATLPLGRYVQLVGAFLLAALLLAILIGGGGGRSRSPEKALFAAGFLMSAVALVLAGRLLLATLSLFFLLLERQTSRTDQIRFSPAEIRFPSLFQPSLRWEELDQVLLKEGLLTLDFRNNRLFQAELQEDLSPEQEAAFNRFCREMVQRAG
ncbi:MAG TPA: hypothetical protein VG870_11740 [Chitinophagaceae bacterium]|nr:hypothetical protein [Chitinophagaceae bacterium]